MPLPKIMEKKMIAWGEAHIERRAQPVPSPSRLQHCKIISHRGDHGDDLSEENTLPAFDRAANAGVWGIEFDIRWTGDMEPVVFHDIDLTRIYGQRHKIADLSLEELRSRFPAIPTLAEMVDHFGKRVHLMIEIKEEPWPNPDGQLARLQQILRPLAPTRDYHLLGLHPRALAPLQRFAPRAQVAISGYWLELRGRWLMHRGWGGLCGHYLLMRSAMVRTLHRNGLSVGTGYVASRNCLFREINRGIDWIFSNDAIGLQQIVDGVSQ